MSRAVGENVATAKFAAPEMFTAGPTRSLGGASSRLHVSWSRVSFSVRADRFTIGFTARVWSRSTSAVPRLSSLIPPTFRALSLVMS